MGTEPQWAPAPVRPQPQRAFSLRAQFCCSSLHTVSTVHPAAAAWHGTHFDTFWYFSHHLCNLLVFFWYFWILAKTQHNYPAARCSNSSISSADFKGRAEAEFGELKTRPSTIATHGKMIWKRNEDNSAAKTQSSSASSTSSARLCVLRIWREAGRIHQLLKTKPFTIVCRNHCNCIRVTLHEQSFKRSGRELVATA